MDELTPEAVLTIGGMTAAGCWAFAAGWALERSKAAFVLALFHTALIGSATGWYAWAVGL